MMDPRLDETPTHLTQLNKPSVCPIQKSMEATVLICSKMQIYKALVVNDMFKSKEIVSNDPEY